MVTAEQNRLYLRSAEKLVAADMGINPDDNALTYEKRAEFNRRLATKILQYPDRFTDQTLATAQKVANTAYDPLVDSSFSASDFASAVLDNTLEAGNAVAGVGQGVLTVAGAARWAIPLVAAVAVVILLVSYSRKTGAIAAA